MLDSLQQQTSRWVRLWVPLYQDVGGIPTMVISMAWELCWNVILAALLYSAFTLLSTSEDIDWDSW